MTKDCKTCKYGQKVEGNPFGSTANGFVSPFTKCTNIDPKTPSYIFGGWCDKYQQEINSS